MRAGFGQVIADPYQIPVSADAPAGPVELRVGMYDIQTMLRLPVFDANGQAYTSNGAFQWQTGNWVFVQDLPSDAAAYSAFLSTID